MIENKVGVAKENQQNTNLIKQTCKSTTAFQKPTPNWVKSIEDKMNSDWKAVE